MRYFIILYILFLTHSVFPQNTEEEKYTPIDSTDYHCEKPGYAPDNVQHQNCYEIGIHPLECDGWMAPEGLIYDGLYQAYHPNHQLKEIGHYCCGIQIGEWEYYNEKGKLIKTTDYKNGETQKRLFCWNSLLLPLIIITFFATIIFIPVLVIFAIMREYQKNKTQVIIISPPKTIEQEHQLLLQLFAQGLEYFHLRKPHFSEEEQEAYLQKITSTYLRKVILHQHLHHAKKYPVKGIHLKESVRKEIKKEDLKKLIHETNIHRQTLSTAVHSLEDLKKINYPYDYVLVSPVFESISKEGYAPSEDWDMKKVKTHPKKIGLGGIDIDKITIVKEKGFDGMALLGAIWQDPEQAVQKFEKIQALCKEAEIR